MENQKDTSPATIYTLRKPHVFEGETYTELNLDFDALTGYDIISSEQQYRAEDPEAAIFGREVNKAYLTYIVARAAKVPADVIRALPAGDFTRVMMKAQNFLLVTG
jgi:hypothetical protein